uniref:CNNM transmembrane domain-containing protein n=1 Tax=Emiliania huxleyi TaxID=2903 RepID=A0A7S3TD06_EMIHU
MSPFLSGCLDTLHEGGVGLDSATALCSKLAALKASPLESLEEEPSHFASFDKPEDWMNLSVALCCMLMAATASGLTMGVVSLDELELRVKERNVNESKTERGYATRILPLIRLSPRHQLLVSLLLLNAIANEAMPLFLDKLVPPWAAILISVTAVLFVGEIIPAAVFTGPAKMRTSTPSSLRPLRDKFAAHYSRSC